MLFLQGKAGEVLAQLKAQMDEASAALEFERAARLRDKITRLQQLQSRQFVESATAGDIDVVAAAAEQGLVAVNVVMIRGGRHVGDRTHFPQHADASLLPEVVAAFLEQHYVERPVPPTIIVSEAGEHDALADVLSAQAGQRVQIVGNPGGERRVWLAMAVQNAEFAIRQQLAQKATQDDRLAALQAALGLPASAQRIECFDVSHTMGERAVASCVIFDRLAMQTGEYRRFNVTPAQGGDDYAAMREALTRRCARIVAGEYPAPDLLVIDGGKGQVARRGRGAGGAGPARHAADRHRQGSGAQARAGGHRVSRSRRCRSTCPPTTPACICCSRSATRRTASRSRAIARGAARRARPRRCRRSPASAPASGRRCSRISAASAACTRRASTTSRGCPASAARWPSASSPSCTRRRTRPRCAAGKVESIPTAEGRSRCAVRPPTMSFNIPTALTWLRIVLIPVFVGRLLPARCLAVAAGEELDRDDDLRGRGDHRLARRLSRAQAGAKSARSARSSIRSPTS